MCSAALVMLANKVTAVRAGDQQQRAQRPSCVRATSFPYRLPEPAQEVAGALCWLSPLCIPPSAPPGMAAAPAPFIGSCGWAQDLLHHWFSTEGREVGIHMEAVPVSVLLWLWSRME